MIDINKGDRIQFLKTLKSSADEESQDNLLAVKGDCGTVDRVGDCKEGYWVFWDKWKSASFGCERKDFELIYDLTKFCSTDELRDCITKPFIMGEYVCASNGHILAFYKGTDALYAKNNDKDLTKSIAEFIKDFQGQSFVKADLKNLPESSMCETCLGTCCSCQETCKECKGDGELELKNDFNAYEVVCKTCHGNGKAVTLDTKSPCLSCKGQGTSVKDEKMDFHGGLINPNYLSMISLWSNLEVCCEPSTLRFYFKSSDGLNAIIMGLKPSEA